MYWLLVISLKFWKIIVSQKFQMQFRLLHIYFRGSNDEFGFFETNIEVASMVWNMFCTILSFFVFGSSIYCSGSSIYCSGSSSMLACRPCRACDYLKLCHFLHLLTQTPFTFYPSNYKVWNKILHETELDFNTIYPLNRLTPGAQGLRKIYKL